MDTRTNILYKDPEIAEKLGAKSGDLAEIPEKLKGAANKALNGKDSVHVPKKSKFAHMQRLAEFSVNKKRKISKKKKRNRMSKQSRKNNR